MLSKSSVYEIKRISFGVFILSIIQMIVVLIAFGYNNSYLFGTLLGASVAILNFVFLAISVENSVKKSQGAAKGYMGSGYFLRLMFMGLIIYFAIIRYNVFFTDNIRHIFFNFILINHA